MITGTIVLPLFALATVTSTFARMTLTLLGILFSFIAISALSATVNHTSISNPLPDHLTLPFMLCGCLAVVALQYRMRRTWLARILLIAIVVLIWAVTSLIPNDAVILRAYPHAEQTQSPLLQVPARDSLDQPTAFFAGSPKKIGIKLPLQIAEIADGYAWSAENMKVVIEGPQGYVWSSPWQAMYARLLPGQQDFSVQFTLSSAIFNQLKSTPVTLHLTLAWTQLHDVAVRHINIPTHDFVVPGFGICSPAVDWTAHSQINGITCRSALRHPRLAYVDTRWSEDPCSGTTTFADGIEGSGWTGTLDLDPADFSLPAVWVNPLPLTNNWNYGEDRPMKARHLCPGTPLIFTEYAVVQRTQSEFMIPNFSLPAYKTSSDAGGASIGLQIPLR